MRADQTFDQPADEFTVPRQTADPLINPARARLSELELPVDSHAPETGASRSGAQVPPKSFYVPELDSLRFLAFLGVFAFHTRFRYAGLSPALGNMILTIDGAGAFGVDLFFVLSAYLITNLLLREKRTTGSLNVSAFYLRRILRIWPLYFFFLGIASLLPLLDAAQHLGWKYLAGYSLLTGNWVTILFGVPSSVANPLWSISMEEQFYLCWPALVKRLSIRGLGLAAIVMLITSNLTRLLVFVLIHPRNESIWFNTFTRLDPIALGILLALLLRAKGIGLGGFGRMLLLCVSLMALLAVSRYADLTGNLRPASVVGLVGYPIVALGCSGIFLAMLGVKAHIVRNAALIYLGKISYGLYVYHALGIWIAERLFGSVHGAAGLAAALCFTIVLASVSYHFLELPFLRWKKRFTQVPSRPI